jgi:hypothetical protein
VDRRKLPHELRLERRTFLRGAGACVALPMLEAMLNSNGTALAQGAPLPRRMVVWFFGNGVKRAQFYPSVTGANWTPSPELMPLSDVKSYVNVIGGHEVKVTRGQGHHTGTVAMLSGASYISQPANGAPFNSKFSIASIDQVMASRLEANAQTKTTFPSLTLGISRRVLSSEGPTLQFISHKGQNQPVPAEREPSVLFDKLFGNFSAPAPTDAARNGLRASILDAVRDDAKALQKKLGSADRQRLDAHLSGIADIRERIVALPPAARCTVPERPTVRNQEASNREPIKAINEAMSRLITMAFACDLTRVVSVHFSSSSGYTSLPEIGTTTDVHNLTHDANAQASVHQAVVYTMEQFAVLMKMLMAQTEGAGNLLDNTAALLASDTAEGFDHSVTDMPVVVVGKGGGTLRYPGVYFRQQGANTSNILLSVMKSVDPTLSSVGGDSGISTTPCSGIMA